MDAILSGLMQSVAGFAFVVNYMESKILRAGAMIANSDQRDIGCRTNAQ